MNNEQIKKKCNECDERGFVKFGNIGRKSCECGYAVDKILKNHLTHCTPDEPCEDCKDNK